jgi:phosphate transport system substrate-binding protein
MPYAKIATRGGVIPLTNETAGNAVNAAKFLAEGDDLVLDLNAMYGSEEPGVYPLLLVTYEIVCSKGYDAQTSAAVKSFLAVSASTAQGELAKAGYVPLPDKVRERLVTAINAMQ